MMQGRKITLSVYFHGIDIKANEADFHDEILENLENFVNQKIFYELFTKSAL